MAVSYNKELRQLAKDEGVALMTIDLPGMTVQGTPKSTTYWLVAIKSLANTLRKHDPEHPALKLFSDEVNYDFN